VTAARALLGARWRHQGRDPATGVDCLGLVVCVARALGYPTTHDRGDYPLWPDGAELRAKLLASGLELLPPARPPAVGAVVQIRFPRDPYPGRHLGVVADAPAGAPAGELHLIHAFQNAPSGGRVIEEPLRRWRPYVTGVFRFPQ
jgi:hypothetical protein